MTLTTKQEEGLKTIISRYNNGEKYTTISGYAGTGKSTLVKFAIEALGVDSKKVSYATFTGKAAEVLRKKGNEGAITLHKLLYNFRPKKNGGFVKTSRDKLESEVVVVDEVSMVPKTLINELLRHKAYVIFLGDPFQLPQIQKEDSHDILDHPHVFLDEIMRQAKESEIIRLTMDIRNGKSIPYCKGNDVIVMPNRDFVDGCFGWADQIIVGTNQKRKEMNAAARKYFGFDGEIPQEGEKMICLRNYWSDISDNMEALVNGTVGTIHNVYDWSYTLPYMIRTKVGFNRDIGMIGCDFQADEENSFYVNMDKKLVLTGEKALDWGIEYQLNKRMVAIGADLVPREFDFGYAITCHKAQGSQWDNVLVMEERFPFDRLEHARWLYTAATRAAEKLVLVR